MASNINPLLPVSGSPTTESVRANFASAKQEIEALQNSTIIGKISGPMTPQPIPNSINPIGDFTTLLLFNDAVIEDQSNLIVDVANSRLLVPPGAKFVRVSYSIAWAGNITGWRGCRIRNKFNHNFGNDRLLSVSAIATTNCKFSTSLLRVTGLLDYAPNTCAVDDYFQLFPAQTSGGDLNACTDTASTFFSLEAYF